MEAMDCIQFEAYKYMLRDLEKECETLPQDEVNEIVQTLGTVLMNLTAKYTEKGAFIQSIITQGT